jgi:hypothetical protein
MIGIRKVDWPALIEELSESPVFGIGLTVCVSVTVVMGLQMVSDAMRSRRTKADPHRAQVDEFMSEVSNYSHGNQRL